ncbi:MAG: histone deacetylase family protein, partial [Caulobacteraceae bacterium]
DMAADDRFSMEKFRRLAEVLVEAGLVGAGEAADGGFHRPEPADFALITGAHDPVYARQMFDACAPREVERRIGLPITRSVVDRSRAATGGTLLTARLALAQGLACNTAGGSHHAARGYGAGFCTFNDVAVASRALLAEGAVERILVVDVDVHQGDGTAFIFEDEPAVFTFSMHGAKNYPARKARSDLDLELPDGTEDAAYLSALAGVLPDLLERVQPQLVFYNAGVDPHADDKLGRLSLSDDGLAARDTYVIETCLRAGAPVAGVIGGGYDADIDRLARRHATLHRAAQAVGSARL